MGDLSAHFSTSEFACHGFGASGHPAHSTVVDRHLVEHLEQLRQLVGRPVRIISGHRCEWWNRRVGGARSSRHLTGQAADIHVGVATVQEAERAGFRGIGRKGRYAVHVDVRPRQARWVY